MIEKLFITLNNFYQLNIIGYVKDLYEYPVKLITLIIDIALVSFILFKIIKLVKDTRAWQLLKGIFFLIIINVLSDILNLNILHYILNYFMTYIVIILIVIFQPELRRALEQIGKSSLSKYFGFEKDYETKTKEDIYKITIATMEMANAKTGALIVIGRDIKLSDIINTGIELKSEISPQLLVNIFCTKTPLHDGAVVIENNKIAAAACMLPLSNNPDIEKTYGTRHRAAMGVTTESDSIAIVVSEETGKVSVSKNGKLITNMTEETLKKFLISNLITKPNKDKIKDNKEEETK